MPTALVYPSCTVFWPAKICSGLGPEQTWFGWQQSEYSALPLIHTDFRFAWEQGEQRTDSSRVIGRERKGSRKGN